MKKIGVLFGQENSYPEAFVERINSKNEKGIMAEYVKIDKVVQAELNDYAVIIDRISQDIPFYRAFLKNAALSGTAVINNPFWWSADDKFFNNALAEKVGVAVPKTVLLPSNQHPNDTNSESMRNLSFPLNWDAIFEYIGFPAFFKPYAGGGWKSVYRVTDEESFFEAYNQTGQLVMMLQEEIKYTEYYRCYGLDRKHVRVMPYEPKNPFHLRYVTDPAPETITLMDKCDDIVIKICESLGYDFNTVELAARDGVLYAIDFCNPAPDADYYSVHPDNFEWIVENSANMAIERAKKHKENTNNLTWGTFMNSFVNNKPLK